MNFERAVKDVYDHPDQSVALAASTLEGIFKTILQNSDPGIQAKNLSLSDLTGKVVKQLVSDCDASAPREIKNSCITATWARQHNRRPAQRQVNCAW